MPLGCQRRVDIASKLAMVRRPTLTELGRKRGNTEKVDTPHTHFVPGYLGDPLPLPTACSPSQNHSIDC